MRGIRFIIISVIVFFLILTGMSLFIPSRIHLSRAVNIDARPDQIIAQVIDLRNWKNWYPGFDSLGALVQDEVEGRWQSVKAGGTTIGITGASDRSVTAVFSNDSRKPVTCTWQVISYEHTDSSTLQWYMDFRLHWYPWEKFSSLLFEKKYGPQMEQGLGRLKSFLNTQQGSTN